MKKNRVWIVFIGLCIYYFVAFGLVYNGVGMFLKPISADMEIPFVQVSLTSTIRILVGMLTTSIAGNILPKVNMKWFLSMNVGILVLAAFIMSYAVSMLQLILGSAMMGFAAGFALYAIVPIIVNQWFAESARYVSIATAVGGAGGIVFCPIITSAITEFGWRGAYRMVGLIILFVMLPLTVFVIRYSPKEYGLEPYVSKKSSSRLGAKQTFEEVADAEENKNMRMYICFVIFFVSAAILSGMYGHIASAFWAKGFSNNQVGYLTSAYQLGTTIAQLLFGMISAKIGLKKTLNLTFPFIMAASIGLIFTGNTAVAWTGILAIMLGIGRAFGAINPILTKYVFGQPDFTKLYSYFYSVFLIGTALTATLFGAIYNMSGSYNPVYVLVFVCAVLELFLVQLIFGNLKRKEKRRMKND